MLGKWGVHFRLIRYDILQAGDNSRIIDQNDINGPGWKREGQTILAKECHWKIVRRGNKSLKHGLCRRRTTKYGTGSISALGFNVFQCVTTFPALAASFSRS